MGVELGGGGGAVSWESCPRGVHLLGNLPRCVCQKVREMGLFLT